MADTAVENKETTVEKEVIEDVETLKKVEVPAEKVAAPENGSTDTNDAKENGEDKVSEEDEETNGDSGEEKKDDETNGDSTDAPAEAVKRKVAPSEAESKAEDIVTPEKKAKLDDSKEVETTNGAEATEIAA